MKAIVIKQPFAGLILTKAKSEEFRSWRPPRAIFSEGISERFLIVAGKSPDPRMKGRSDMDGACYILGQAIASARIEAVRQPTPEMWIEPGCPSGYTGWAWKLVDVEKVPPFCVTGRLGFFEVEAPSHIMAQMAAAEPT